MVKELSKEEIQERIAKRVALELPNNSLVNLGIGLPTKVARFLPEGVTIMLQSENGFVGLDKVGDEIDPTIVNAGGQPVGIVPGGAFFDSTTSFGIIRGGHVDATVLGALQIDEKGNIANYLIPGKMVPGMGGAMDLLVGAKKVIVAMEHTNKGKWKILKECSLPLTAAGVVDKIVTEMGVFTVTPEGIAVEEIHPDYTFEEVQEATEARLIYHN
ncbi:acetate CoA-transferase beta subunit [Streptococcus equi subsp. zooepidemicus Sz35]|uniref:3-oxoacid CoA-transferase subunit B n=1 Tax=Streptococcus equi TaxID=1336 RepID=UPI0005BB978A|nr:3-oxoacid CoA-transferase subunit B [Streptococcus equi]KIS18820.1 acetate CoA-transferase beta subunit [Streptococcus equi subsp. zooepidemicus Sz35]MCD3402928.1 3-oxoacid CoA-transferase subunit B [Streptococcus equi subsp. zooepidemicus]MCD3441628.1 3-oxoacid CoA-transferase subunit B [Streptococcus equi subsp. zooepidemicus]HEL0659830.1 3-oxoacid CoA-transferase subunit B [Streptococcus equi subsp. zooepidemicus]HEL0677030.1 3-oxoacid CoA-transferase subunit B [Streptococcus equi subsp.